MARGIKRNGGGGQGLLLLAATIYQIGTENIPPVTLALVAGQSAIFMGFFPEWFQSPDSVCISSYLVLTRRDWRRLILGTFTHGSDTHLYFNMVSLIYKGIKLERHFGSMYFAYLISVFTGLTSLLYVGLGQGLSAALQDNSYSMSCAVGFSGVLFALKVLATEFSGPGMQYAFGVIPVPSRYIFWAELILIQLSAPNASFVGHLAGILVGLAYTRGPLRLIMDAFLTPENNTPGVTPSSSDFNLQRRGRSPSQRSSISSMWDSALDLLNFGHRPDAPPEPVTSSARFHQNPQPSGSTSVHADSSQNHAQFTDHQPPGPPDQAEIRRRRTLYYQPRT